MDPNPMRSCPECRLPLFQQQDAENGILVMKCPNCNYTEPAENNPAHQNQVEPPAHQNQVEPPAHQNQVEPPAQWNVVHRPARSFTRFIDDAHLDVTLPRARTVPCPRCNGREAVYYEDISRVREKDSMVLSYNCCNPNCLHKWRRH